MAEETGDGEKVKGLQDQLNELEERAEALDRQRTKNISAIRLEAHIIHENRHKPSHFHNNVSMLSLQLYQPEESELEHCGIWEGSGGKCCWLSGWFLRFCNVKNYSGIWNALIVSQAEGQNAKNQQMDPFTRRQCKPTMVSNVSPTSIHIDTKSQIWSSLLILIFHSYFIPGKRSLSPRCYSGSSQPEIRFRLGPGQPPAS